MREVARVLVGDTRLDFLARRAQPDSGEKFVHVFCLGDERLCLRCVCRVLGEQVAIFFHRRAAASGVGDDGVDVLGEHGIDVLACKITGVLAKSRMRM